MYYMYKYKVIYCIDYYEITGGASIALIETIKSNPKLEKYIIACRNCTLPEHFVFKKSGKEIIEEYLSGNYDFIHWFKSAGFKLFRELVREAHRRHLHPNIITTVCQRPSFKLHLLSPIEIKHSLALVFIDKAAYNDSLYAFIPSELKRMIYFGTSKYTLEILNSVLEEGTSDKKKLEIIYGRGSTLNKCPKDMFKIFDGINSPKHFVIVGNGDDRWIKKEARKRDDYTVEIIQGLPYKKWLEVLKNFDVFLYYLPLSAYSSIDGTLGDAMLLKKPVVYYGPDAPKERLINGYNALVASSKEDIIKYCNLLLSDEQLRTTLGEHARETTLRDFPMCKTIDSYNQLYRDLQTKQNDADTPRIRIPLDFYFYYGLITCKNFITKCIRKTINICLKSR